MTSKLSVGSLHIAFSIHVTSTIVVYNHSTTVADNVKGKIQKAGSIEMMFPALMQFIINTEL